MRTKARVGRWVAIGTALAMAVTWGGFSIAEAVGPAETTVKACYNKKNLKLRLRGSAAACKPNETAIEWSQSGGAKGDTGATGPQGAPGPQGAQGPQGPAGNDGAQGPQGPVGSTGADGLSGFNGRDGIDGLNGINGATGPRGPSDVYYDYDESDYSHPTPGGQYEILRLSNVPTGVYALTAEARFYNPFVIDGASFFCDWSDSTHTNWSRTHTAMGPLQRGHIVVSHAGPLSGNVTLRCWSDQAHFSEGSNMMAVRVDTATRTRGGPIP